MTGGPLTPGGALPPASLDRLGAWLRTRGILGGGTLTARLAGDGHSNLTYVVGNGEREVVVRRPPPPPLPPGANDVLREAAILHSLRGTRVPVPRVLATGASGEVFDVPFFVMEFIAGPIVASGPAPAGIGGAALAAGMTRVLADLHAVDWAAGGIRGHAEGSNLRHRSRIARLVADDAGAPPPAFADVDAWLIENAPAESGAALLHNDFRLGNLVLDPTGTRVAAVLDWELASVGDPLVDLGYLVAAWAEPGREPETPIERLGSATAAAGFPTRADLVDAYAAASGRDVGGLAWYVALAEWKLAVLWEYNRRRVEAGVGDPYYADPAQVTEFLDAARRWAERA